MHYKFWRTHLDLPLASDEKKKEGFVRVIVAIKNLTTTRKGIKLVKKPDNADVQVTFEEM